MLAFKNLDATTVFHSFHANSKFAYKKLGELLASQPNKSENDLVFASSTLSDEVFSPKRIFSIFSMFKLPLEVSFGG